MMQNVDPSDLVIGIVGTGTMGRGIVQIALTGGYRVKMFDSVGGAAEAARDFVTRMINRAAEKGRMPGSEATEAVNRLEIVETLDELAGCGLVIEAIVENLEVKQELVRKLETIVSPETVLASNTSSLSVTAIASVCDRPERVAGYHFFNPVPLLKVVEVVAGELTASRVVEGLDSVARQCGHEPVRTRDTPGFLVNHAGRGLYTEGARIVSEGIAEPHQVDDVMREYAGFRMGPFELMDTTGLDVSGVVMESIYNQFYQEPRFRPLAFIRNRMAAGLYGRKTGQGFYSYKDNRKQPPTEPDPPTLKPETVWLGGPGSSALAEFLDGKVRMETGARPSSADICLVAPLGSDATTTAIDMELDPERTVAVDTLFGLGREENAHDHERD